MRPPFGVLRREAAVEAGEDVLGVTAAAAAVTAAHSDGDDLEFSRSNMNFSFLLGFKSLKENSFFLVRGVSTEVFIYF
jgi:hypothetical protein